MRHTSLYSGNDSNANIAAPPRDSILGCRVAGRYEVVRHLSTGGMASVYEAIDTRSQATRVALKILHPHHAREPTIVRRFEREAQLASGLDPRYVPTARDSGRWENLHYLVLDLLVGEDLRQVLKRLGRLPVTECVDVVLDVCRALRGAHIRGVVHRDVKPSNIFLALAEDRGPRAKLLDFGIAKHSGEAGTTGEFTLLGTIAYMAPEQIVSSKRVDHRADIYSLGLVLYEALNGRPAYDGERARVLYDIVHGPGLSFADFDPHVPHAVASAAITATARETDSRHLDVDTFAASLAPFAGNGLLRLTGPYLGSKTSEKAASGEVNPTLSATRADPLSESSALKANGQHSRMLRFNRGRRWAMLGMTATTASLMGTLGWTSTIAPASHAAAIPPAPAGESIHVGDQLAPAVISTRSSSNGEACDGEESSIDRGRCVTTLDEKLISLEVESPSANHSPRNAPSTSPRTTLLIEPGTIFVPDNPYDAH